LASVAGAAFNPVGGLVGNNQNAISQSYAAGDVQGGIGGSVGGLVGFAFEPQGIAANSDWDIQSTGQLSSAGAPGFTGLGQSTAQLQSGTLPTGFDPTVWVAIPEQYPLLQWQVPVKPIFPVVFVHGLCSSADTWSDA
jgi:hypothetical protein